MTVTNSVSPSRRYRVSMMAEDETQVQETVTLPANLPNNAATVELWYHAYIPKGHLIVDIEPAETVKEPPIPGAEEEDSAETKEQSAKYRGFGDSLEYVGEDEPTNEESEEDDNGGTFIAGVEDSPKGGY